jgi:hypothetical protein
MAFKVLFPDPYFKIPPRGQLAKQQVCCELWDGMAPGVCVDPPTYAKVGSMYTGGHGRGSAGHGQLVVVGARANAMIEEGRREQKRKPWSARKRVHVVRHIGPLQLMCEYSSNGRGEGRANH